MTDVRSILDDTANFAASMDDLTQKMSHMERMLTLVGQHKINDHSCWFCRRVVGNNATGELGLMKELVREIKGSSADAMRQIQLATASALTGTALVSVSSAVQK